MTDVLRRHKYAVNRILIPTARILSPEFNAAYLFLTGAHIELLRNLVDYANRETSFVTTYEDGYYLSPTSGEWDAIGAIVAELEEILMGVQNVAWGYSGKVSGQSAHTMTSTAGYNLLSDAVPEGEVWLMQQLSAVNLDKQVTHQFWVSDGSYLVPIGAQETVPAYIWSIYQHSGLLLAEGDVVLVSFGVCDENDELLLRWSGYKMAVPT